jgi:hypothetical protein
VITLSASSHDGMIILISEMKKMDLEMDDAERDEERRRKLRLPLAINCAQA